METAKNKLENAEQEFGKEFQTYRHRVQYYETDGMQIVHHSNYIRWMEEARSEYLAQIGLPYDEMERHGILIPVLSVACDYKQSARYGDTVKIFAEVEKFNGIKFSVKYRMTSEDETVVYATGTTGHCFLGKNMKPVNVKKIAPKIYDYFSQYRVKR